MRARWDRGDGGEGGALDEGRKARGQEGGAKGSAKVQIGAKLLCKSAKVFLGLEPELGLGLGNFQVSGLGRRGPGSGVRVRVQVRDLNFDRHPHLYLNTRTRDLRAETWDPKMALTFAPLHRPQAGLHFCT